MRRHLIDSDNTASFDTVESWASEAWHLGTCVRGNESDSKPQEKSKSQKRTKLKSTNGKRTTIELSDDDVKGGWGLVWRVAGWMQGSRFGKLVAPLEPTKQG